MNNCCLWLLLLMCCCNKKCDQTDEFGDCLGCGYNDSRQSRCGSGCDCTTLLLIMMAMQCCCQRPVVAGTGGTGTGGTGTGGTGTGGGTTPEKPPENPTP